MMFSLKIAKFAPVWTTILKIRAIFVHQTLTEHALYYPTFSQHVEMSSSADINPKSYCLIGKALRA